MSWNSVKLCSLVCLCWLVLVSVNASASSPPFAVSGFASLPSGVEDVEVTAVLLESNFDKGRSMLARGSGRAVNLRTTLDPAGRYFLALPGPGVYEIRVEAVGALPMVYGPLPVTGSHELPPVALAVGDVSRVEVVTARGEPVPGALIVADTADAALWEERSPGGWMPAPRFGWSDEAGMALLDRATTELLDIRVLPYPSDATVIGGRRLENIRFVLPRRRGSAGIVEVREVDGTPVPGVLVQLATGDLPLGLTDAEGRLRLRGGVRPDTRFQVWSGDGRRLQPDARQRTDDGRIVLRLHPQATLTGSVCNHQGRGISRALIWNNRDPGRFVVTGDEGAYRLFSTPAAPRSWFQVEAKGFLSEAREVPTGETMKLAPICLQPSVPVSGRVLRGDGSPAAGILVEASAAADATPHFRRDPADGRAVSGEDGGFRIDGLAPGIPHQVQVIDRAFWSPALQVSPAAEDVRIDLRQRRGSFGRVEDAAGTPLPGIVVEMRAEGRPAVLSSPDGEVPSAVTDETGTFRFATVPAGHVSLVAHGKGWAPLTVRGVEVGEETADDHDLGTLVLTPGARISGRIVDAAGTSLADVEIGVEPGDVRRRSRSRPESEVRSDAEGWFRVDDLDRGAVYDLAITHPGFLDLRLGRVRAPTSEPLEVVLQATAALRGKVVDLAGEAIEGAAVEAQPADIPPGQAGLTRQEGLTDGRAETDGEGRYEIVGLAPGTFEVTAWSSQHRPSPPRRVTLEEGAGLELETLVLETGERLQGRVTDGRGKPVEGARVSAGKSSARTDPRGNYALGGLTPGEHTVKVRHARYPRQLRDVEIETGVNLLDVTLKGGHRVSGQVSVEGEPTGGIGLILEPDGVRGRSYSAISSASGEFTFAMVPDGEFRLVVEDVDHHLPERVTVRVGGEAVSGLNLDLVHSAEVSGAILGLPPEDLLRVRVRADDGERQRPGRIDYQGTFRIAGLGPGSWDLHAYLPGGRREAHSHLVVQPGDRRLREDIEFRRGSDLSGLVRYGGDPLANAGVVLRHLDSGRERATRTDHEGYFRLQDLSSGSHRVTVTETRRSLVHNERIEVSGDLDLRIDIRSGRVAGRVEAAESGSPLADALVMLGQLDGEGRTEISRHTVGTGGDGSFRFWRISEGTYRVQVTSDGFTPYEESLVMGPGSDAENLRIRLERSPGLELRVRGPGGSPVAHVTASFLDPASGRSVHLRSRPADGEGVVVFPSAPAGDWRLLVEGPDGALVSTLAEIPGSRVEVGFPPVGAVEVEVPELMADRGLARMVLEGAGGQVLHRLDASTGQRTETHWLRNGRGTVQGVPPGAWTVEVRASDGRVYRGAVELAAGGLARVVLQ